MKKSWKLIPKILSGEKTIEARWYKARYAPWNRIEKGDTIYFKNSGEPVTAVAKVDKVVQFDNFSKIEQKEIINKHYKQLGLGKKSVSQHSEGKKFGDIRFLEKSQRIIGTLQN